MADDITLSPDAEEDIAADQADSVSEPEKIVPEASKAESNDREENEAPAERTPRRREERDFEVSGDVTIDGKAFPLRDWSSSGFGIVSCDLEFEDHARVGIDFNVTHSAGTLSFSCKAIIVRSDTVSCEVAGAFVEMAREDRVAVTDYFDAMDED